MVGALGSVWLDHSSPAQAYHGVAVVMHEQCNALTGVML